MVVDTTKGYVLILLRQKRCFYVKGDFHFQKKYKCLNKVVLQMISRRNCHPKVAPVKQCGFLVNFSSSSEQSLLSVTCQGNSLARFCPKSDTAETLWSHQLLKWVGWEPRA